MFLCQGWTSSTEEKHKQFLKHEGKAPSESDRLTTDVIGVTRTSIQYLNRVVAIGSRSQDLHGAVKTKRRTSASETGTKLWSTAQVSGGLRLVVFRCACKGNAACMIEILLMKKDPKVSASAATEEWSERCIAGQRWRILSKAFHKDG